MRMDRLVSDFLLFGFRWSILFFSSVWDVKYPSIHLSDIKLSFELKSLSFTSGWWKIMFLNVCTPKVNRWGMYLTWSKGIGSYYVPAVWCSLLEQYDSRSCFLLRQPWCSVSPGVYPQSDGCCLEGDSGQTDTGLLLCTGLTAVIPPHSLTPFCYTTESLSFALLSFSFHLLPFCLLCVFVAHKILQVVSPCPFVLLSYIRVLLCTLVVKKKSVEQSFSPIGATQRTKPDGVSGPSFLESSQNLNCCCIHCRVLQLDALTEL